MASKWMQKESEREKKAGTKGKFSRKAKRAGKSTAEFAREKASAPGELGKEARMAKMFAKGRKSQKRKKSRGRGR